MKTAYPNINDMPQGWHLVDAENQVLGRMASRIARVLMGKHRPIYSPHMDTGEFVVIVNADKINLTGRKQEDRVVRYHTGWIGGLREIPMPRFKQQKPEEVVRLAIRRMLPKTKLGRRMLSKLKVYRGADHPHQAQNPQVLDLKTI